MSIKVKICGIRTLEVAQAAIGLGADYLGFNFVPASRRFIEPKHAAEIIEEIKGKVQIVGVFQNAPIQYVNNLVRFLGLDFVQLHGDESQEFYKKTNAKVIKSFSVSTNTSAEQLINKMQGYQVDYFLLDREAQGQGLPVSQEATQIVAQKFPIFLAGGLNKNTVGTVVNKVKPYGVDVASGIETNGLTDVQKIKPFIQNAKRSFV